MVFTQALTKFLQTIFQMVSKGDGRGRYTQAPQLQGTAGAAASRTGSSATHPEGWATATQHFSQHKKTGDGDKHTHLGSRLPLLTLVTLRKERRERSAPSRYRPHTVHAYIQMLQ